MVDVDRLDRNLRRWQDECNRLGLANRPHVKTHRSVEIARRQLELGAVGLTCQKLGEAETMVDAGFDDLLVPYNLVGARKLDRLAALLRRATIRVSFDDRALLPGLRFDGFLTHPAPPGALRFLREAVELCSVPVETVSAGGTPTMWKAHELQPTVTEYRAGTYAFGDMNTVAAGVGRLEEVALTVRATVVSRPAPDRAVLDAGSKTLASDAGADGRHGRILEAQSSAIAKLDEEHAYVRLDPSESLELGQTVSIVPNHACVVANLFDELVVVRAGEVVAGWPVDARGRSR